MSFRARSTCIFLGLILILLTSCSDPRAVVLGKWSADQAPLISLYFYDDGTASFTGTGLLKLRWKPIDDAQVKIEALDQKLVFHFRIAKDTSGYFGILELAGYDAWTFRKR